MPLLQPPGPDLRAGDLSYTHAYHSIVSRVRKGKGPGSGGVIILSGCDVVCLILLDLESRSSQDGLLASRILTSMFNQDDIPYRLVPVGGYSELDSRKEEALNSEELHTLILLSLGSLLPLMTYFELPPHCHLHVIDAHRPWNLSNLFGLDFAVDEEGEAVGEGRIWIWGDGEENVLGQVKKSWEALEYAPSDSESDDESDDEVDEDDEEEDDEEEEEGQDEEGDDEESVEQRRKRRKGSAEGVKKKRKKDEGGDEAVSSRALQSDLPLMSVAKDPSCGQRSPS